MSTSNWQSNATPSGSGEALQFMTTLDGFSYTPSEAEKTRNTAQVAATGRKSWKTLKGKGEAVWPPTLETALIEALKQYDFDNTGKNEKSQRYPKRNRYVAEYIFAQTGKRRQPKQVGSRLQQLRDTCKDESILRLVKPRAAAQSRSQRASSEESSGSSVGDPRSPRASLSSQPLLGVVISLQDQFFPSPLPSISLADNGFDRMIQLSPCVNAASSSAGPSSNTLPYLSKMVELVSPVPLELETTFSVYREGSLQPLHFEAAPLRCVPYSSGRSGWVYRSELVPSFWESLCFTQGQDITNYKILQRLRLSNASASDATASAVQETVGVMYTFSVPSSSSSQASHLHFPARRSPAALPPPAVGVANQHLSYSSQAMHTHAASSGSSSSSALNYPSYPGVPDNLEDSWIPNLTASPSSSSSYSDSRGSPHISQYYQQHQLQHHQPMANAQPRSMSQSSSYYGSDTTYREHRDEVPPNYLPTTSSNSSFYPEVDARSNQSIHAPVPVSHHQHFHPYHPYSRL